MAMCGTFHALVFAFFWTAASILDFADKTDNLCLHDFNGTPARERRWRGRPGRNLTMFVSGDYWTSQEIISRIIAILVTEKLGVHLDYDVVGDVDVEPMWLATAGCQEAWEFECSGDNFDGTKPLIDFAAEFWPERKSLESIDSITADVTDSELKSRVVDMGAMGYVARSTLNIWQEVVDDAANRSSGRLSLDWSKDLLLPEAMQHFTPLRDFDVSRGMYQYCEHADAERLEAWGYVCNGDFDHDDPWRMPDENGNWSESGARPNRPRPLFNCSEMDEIHPSVAERYRDVGLVCKGDGWWLAPPCAARSPGDEYLDNCIPVFSYNPVSPTDHLRSIVGLPAAMAQITYWDAVEEYVYDWAETHQYRGTPTVALFVWWTPDASLRLNYEGSPTAVKSARTADIHFTPEFKVAGVPPTTIIHEDVYKFAPEVAGLLPRIKLSDEDLSWLMERVVELATSGGPDGKPLDLPMAKDAAACDWILNNIQTWEAWVGADSCWADTFFDMSLGRCQPCPTGTSSKRGSQGVGSCRPCPVGQKYQAGAGCIPCDPGSYSNGTGHCLLCPQGTYQPLSEASNCTPCDSGRSTASVGNQDLSSCVCDVGSYGDNETCTRCTPGMFCQEIGIEVPGQAAGYQVTPGEFRVYKCVDEEACPGDVAGTCAGGRVGIACGTCNAGYVLSGGECTMCTSFSVSGIIGLGLLGVIFCLGAYYLSNSAPTLNASAVLALNLAVGITITSVQILGTFNQLRTPWPHSISRSLGVMQFLNFDAKAFDIPCSLGPEPSVKYLFTCLFPLAGVCCFFGLHFASKLLSSALPRGAWKLDMTLSSIGQFIQVFFISMCLSVVVPHQCYSHPDGSASVVRYPTVICDSPEHLPLVIESVFLLISFPVPFLVITFWANCKAASIVGTDDRTKFLTRYRFLIFRFRPEVWWWGNVINIRQLLLAIAPMLTPDDPSMQTVYCVAVLSWYGVAMVFWPWKTKELNILDSIFVVLLTVMMAGVAAFIPQSDREIHHLVVLWCALTSIFVAGCALIASVLHTLFRKGNIHDFGRSPNCTRSDEFARQWTSFCTAYARLTPETSKQVVQAMSHYDRVRLLETMSSVENVCLGAFTLPRGLTSARLYMEHSKCHGAAIFDAVNEDLNRKPLPFEAQESSCHQSGNDTTQVQLTGWGQSSALEHIPSSADHCGQPDESPERAAEDLQHVAGSGKQEQNECQKLSSEEIGIWV